MRPGRSGNERTDVVLVVKPTFVEKNILILVMIIFVFLIFSDQIILCMVLVWQPFLLTKRILRSSSSTLTNMN